MNNYRIRGRSTRQPKNRHATRRPYWTSTFPVPFGLSEKQLKKALKHGQLLFRAIVNTNSISCSVYRVLGKAKKERSFRHPNMRKRVRLLEETSIAAHKMMYGDQAETKKRYDHHLHGGVFAAVVVGGYHVTRTGIEYDEYQRDIAQARSERQVLENIKDGTGYYEHKIGQMQHLSSLTGSMVFTTLSRAAFLGACKKLLASKYVEGMFAKRQEEHEELIALDDYYDREEIEYPEEVESSLEDENY